jgi:hypothetical protein
MREKVNLEMIVCLYSGRYSGVCIDDDDVRFQSLSTTPIDHGTPPRRLNPRKLKIVAVGTCR